MTLAAGASVCANGGGGGEGGQLAMTSTDGQPATCSDTTFALGGAGQVDGGDGGAGSAGSQADGADGKNGGAGAGGGGGGGGVGRIRTHGRTSQTIDPGAHVSPSPMS